jgi:formylglycine-generating enzyme required for sulfatase activity
LQGTANVAGILAGRSWIGAFDLGGNVWEWVSSLYLPYDSQEDREGDPGTRTAALRVLRGGSWGDDYFRGLRAGFRSWNDPFDRYNYGGFRCARSS